MTLVYLEPCAINLPHTHPRASEINLLIDGQLQLGFFQENSASFIMNNLERNQAAVFPIGSIHFEQNLGCTRAIFLAAFNHEDPGILTIASGLFGALPATVVGASLGGLEISTIEDIRMNIGQSPSVGIAECYQRCGLWTFVIYFQRCSWGKMFYFQPEPI